MPKPLHKDVKQMDDNLVDYFAKERDSGEPLLPLTAVQDRVAAALGVYILPRNRDPRTKQVCDISTSEQCAIRECLYGMVEEKIHVTRSPLIDCLKEKHIFEGSVSSLGKILHSQLGFVIRQPVYGSVLWNYNMLFMQEPNSYVNTCTISRTQILCHVYILMKHGYLKMVR
ncbi:hypothetical protein Zmor_021211 [Zophobas morio]|uniref:Uncharacterized protein n=1 Tax=Zophobas morio TaxID=2755281 RepID=A0AA38I5J8_9CUCU|nr:hypothetical protein Zmor_021211 [Zophobas morio]